MRLVALLIACALAVAGPCQLPGPSTADRGSVPVAGVAGPDVAPGQLAFAGALRGTSTARHEACEVGGKTYRHFNVTATGDVDGREYFLYATIYPYAGPDVYELKAVPAAPIDHMPRSPNPLVDESSGDGFFNVVPKWEPGNAYGQDPRGADRSYMAVDKGEQTGWLVLRMITLNQQGSPRHLEIKGRFVCGPAFQI
jgi:hypothetical protein